MTRWDPLAQAGTPGVRPLTRARRLRPGDRVAIIAPAGPVPDERLDEGLALVRGWDLEPVVMPHTRGSHREFGYLSGTDEERAADLTRAWCDPSYAAVFCARGGYGAQRMADLVDWAAIRAAGPKVFVGYSDITALHEAFAVRAGFATLHGPMPGAMTFLKDEATRESLRATLFEPESRLTLGLPAARALVPGRARGITLGGCASLLAADLGTRHARPGTAGGLLLLEDVDEQDYRLDRILTQLIRSGWLDGVAGIALGSWAECGPYEQLRELFRDRLGHLGVPVVEELGFGHGPTNLTVPFGVPAVLDADAEAATLTLEEPALV
ncbi:S66 peptidase family protein [Streptomyces qinzhouensis]|uniref:LD-carboxypeptidase n=1 Tax=Streptomyces qinzhouensis TaxID=2599401 RepID=A0A5B8JHL6_9ACTN|nr:LD-carboxypeptidase [Streptomyces qinzhouensis]QDY79834.1 LD-carboxypeptidase [Streptomyces qinzhouensis]